MDSEGYSNLEAKSTNEERNWDWGRRTGSIVGIEGNWRNVGEGNHRENEDPGGGEGFLEQEGEKSGERNII